MTNLTREDAVNLIAKTLSGQSFPSRETFSKALGIYNALIEAGVIPQWRPIESAPKDREVLLHVVGYTWSIIGIWNEPSKKWCYAELSVDLYDGKWCDTSFQSEYESEVDSKGLPNVTHWMPLPIPPKE
jgi:hypothetical protein